MKGFCEHCGPVKGPTYDDPQGGTTWCGMCMLANGYPKPWKRVWK